MIVIDYFNNKPLKESKDTPFIYGDLLTTIKEKVVVCLSDNLTPELIAVATKSNGNIFTFMNGAMTINSDTIYFFDLIEDLSRTLLPKLHEYPLDELTNENSAVIKKIYTDLSTSYTDLKKHTLTLVIKMILYQNIPMMFDNYKDQITAFKRTMTALKQDLINKYKKQVVSDNIINEIYDGKLEYSILNSIIQYKISDKPLDFYKIIKEIKLDDTVPLVYFTDSDIKQPVIKFYKNTSIDVKNAIFDKDQIKAIRGLTFRVLMNNGSDSVNYFYIILSKNTPKLSLRISWPSRNSIHFQDTHLATKNIKVLINKLNNIFRNITLERQGIYEYNAIQFNINKRVSFNKLKLAINNNPDLFKLEVSPKDVKLIGVYLPYNIKFIIKNSQLPLNDEKLLNINTIDVFGVSNEQIMFIVMKSIGKLFYEASKLKSVVFKDGKFIEELNGKQSIDVKNVQNIKKLKGKGIVINPRSCQKERQPRIIDKPTKTSITFKGIHLNCNVSDVYKYPGFTTDNSVCCFKKNQREKINYKKNMQEVFVERLEHISDSVILKNRIIQTDKVLVNGQLGILPSFLSKNLFDDTCYRLGCSGKLLNCMNIANSTNYTIDDINGSITMDVFKFINNGFFYKNGMTKSEFIEYIKRHEIVDLLSILFKVNIIVFESSDNHIVCKENLYLPHKKYVFILNNSNSYELITQVKGNKIIKVFTDIPVINKIHDLYNNSCIVKYIGSNNSPPVHIFELMKKDITIKAQVVNKFNNVIYVVTEYGLIPVVPVSPLYNKKKVNIKTVMLDASKQAKLLVSSKITSLKPVGQIVHKNYTIGIIIKNGQVVPTSNSNVLSLPIIYRQLINDIDDEIASGVYVVDQLHGYILHVKFYKELFQRFRFTLSQLIFDLKIQKIDKDVINNIMKDQVAFTTNKLKVTKEIPNVRKVCRQLNDCSTDPFCVKSGSECKLLLTKKMYKDFIDKVLIEIKSNKDILKGNVNANLLDINDYIKRPNEVILLNKDDIIKYFGV